jgi:uncharacterized protein
MKRILNPSQKHSFFLFGPRQVGKSTLIKQLFTENIETYDLLKTDEYMRLKANPHLFREEVLALNDQIKHIFIDEVQRIPELLNEVHYLMESNDRPLHFILTGSSARKLKRAKANLLAGRAWTLSLHPLSFHELHKAKSFSLKRVLEMGSLPKIYLEQDDLSAKHYLKSYVETYLKEEIEAEALVRSSGTFLRFLFLAGHESGNPLNFSAISREVGTTHTTVKEYFQILEDTLLGFLLFPYHKSLRKRLSKHPKFYFFDTGVQRALTKKLSLSLEPKTSEYGIAFEHWIINETVRINHYHDKDWEFSYIRTESGNEIDLIIETPSGKTIAVEIKSSEQPALNKIKTAMKLFDGYDNLVQLCVCTTQRKRENGPLLIIGYKDYFDFLVSLK